MKPPFALLFSLCALALASCGKNEPAKPAALSAPVPPPPPAVAAEPKKDPPEVLQKLQGQLPRLDPEKAKFIAVPSTPPDPKTEEKKSEEIKKADAAK